MLESELRHLFSRYQNLNLLALAGAIKAGNVGWGGFVREFTATDGEDVRMCPIAHGLARHVKSQRGTDCYAASGFLPEDHDMAGAFWQWWDGIDEMRPVRPERRKLLLSVLESIYAERLEDALVVQEVCAGATHGVEAVPV